MIRYVLAALAALSLCVSSVQAKPGTGGSGSVTQFCGDRVCGFVPEGSTKKWTQKTEVPARSKTATRKSVERPRAAAQPSPDRANALQTTYEARIIPHPHGCPSKLFCGCGLCVHFFGRPCVAGGLAFARGWLRFPPADPAPGMVAVSLTHSHVFAIEKVLSRGLVLARDYNSGHHQSKLHIRSLAGTSVRNPHSGRRVAWLR